MWILSFSRLFRSPIHAGWRLLLPIGPLLP